jgi:hypothetical protein
LPIDQILKPKSKYYGEDYHKLALEEMYKAYTLVHRRSKEAFQKRQRLETNRRMTQPLEEADPVMYKMQEPKSKFDNRWREGYQVLKRIGDASYRVVDQRTGRIFTARREHLKLDNEPWQETASATRIGNKRNATYALEPETEDNVQEPREEDEEDNNIWGGVEPPEPQTIYQQQSQSSRSEKENEREARDRRNKETDGERRIIEDTIIKESREQKGEEHKEQPMEEQEEVPMEEHNRPDREVQAETVDQMDETAPEDTPAMNTRQATKKRAEERSRAMKRNKEESNEGYIYTEESAAKRQQIEMIKSGIEESTEEKLKIHCGY